MRYALSRKMPTLGQWLAGLCLFLTAWLHGVAVQAADILLTGAGRLASGWKCTRSVGRSSLRA